MTESTLLLDGREPANIRAAARLIMTGGVIAVPTDTLYGLAANVLDDAAVARVFDIKQRPVGQPMPVLLASARDSILVAREVPREAWPLIQRFWPGALTLVLPARPSLSPTVRAGGRTVAVRVPSGVCLLQLLEAVGTPLTGTSANLHGMATATTPEGVVAQLRGAIDAVLIDSAQVPIGVASTVVEFVENTCMVYRRGAISVDALRETLGPRIRVQVSA